MAQKNTGYILRRASPEQIRVMYKNTVAEWGQGITEEQYFEREYMLAAQPGFTGEYLTRWVYVPANDPETLELLAHCETFDRPALLAHNGSVKEVRCWAVASVFCPEPLRGNGYASNMMALLWEEAKRSGATLTSLVSDVGPKFYSRFGWHVYPSSEVQFPAVQRKENRAVTPLYLGDLELLEKADGRRQRARLQEIIEQSDSNTDSHPLAIILPTAANFLWHRKREEFYANIDGVDLSSGIIGATTVPRSNTTDAEALSTWADQVVQNFVIWQHDIRKQTLRILRFQCTDLSNAQSLIEVARHEAHRTGIPTVVAWLSEEDAQEANILRQCPGGSIVHRDHTLPSLGWLTDPTPSQSSGAKVRWLLCERFTWI
jgi:hypothetical protein